MEGLIGYRVRRLHLLVVALEVGHTSVLAFVLLLRTAVVVVLVGAAFTLCPVVVQAEHMVVVMVREHRHRLHALHILCGKALRAPPAAEYSL